MYGNETPKAYRAGIYLRLSKEDGDKIESNSVQTQRALIHSFVRKQNDILVVSEKIDDGFSGVTFDRPAFQELLEEIKSGAVNCVIVKDLSRFGRNYIEAGKYIEQIFPFLGVRFIAINDNIDTAKENGYTNSIVVPFKNLLNDAYSRDISIKVRSQLEMRQKRGDFVGAFPVYGYIRAQDDKHKLKIDKNAAEIIRKIFAMRMDGFNNLYIADYLNRLGIPSPMEYKTLKEEGFFTSFKQNPKAKWSPMAVDRLLKNEMYTGNMIQGKETTLNYKAKKRTRKPRRDWIRVENTHDAIIPKEDFEIVQQIMGNDTRTAPQREELYLLSGMLRCGGCGSSMVRKIVRARGTTYTYYICSKNKENKNECSSHRIREDAVLEAVSVLLQKHSAICNQLQGESSSECKQFLKAQEKMQKITEQIRCKNEELKKYKALKNYIYEDYKDGILTMVDYQNMKEYYERICMEIGESIHFLMLEKEHLETGDFKQKWCIVEPQEKDYFQELRRSALVLMIEKIIVLDGKTIKILMRYQDEFVVNNELMK
ncbi:Recombinase [anaerobic digester metagenome]